MLGYPGVQTYKTTNFTPVKGIIWMENVACSGTETLIADCSHNGWGRADCYHSTDVGVTCKPGRLLKRNSFRSFVFFVSYYICVVI